MQFKNKNTGVVWHITDKDHQSRLQARSDYVVVTNVNHREKTQSDASEPVKDSKFEKVDFKSLDWQELRQFATEQGINTHGKKRKQIERELKEVGGVNDR